jgi:hypothetical protein
MWQLRLWPGVGRVVPEGGFDTLLHCKVFVIVFQ